MARAVAAVAHRLAQVQPRHQGSSQRRPPRPRQLWIAVEVAFKITAKGAAAKTAAKAVATVAPARCGSSQRRPRRPRQLWAAVEAAVKIAAG